MRAALKIVFHGDNAANFRPGLEDLLQGSHHIVTVSQGFEGPEDKAHFETADVVVGVTLNADMPYPHKIRFFKHLRLAQMAFNAVAFRSIRNWPIALAMRMPSLNT